MEFKSKIATTREQSERLLALGMKPETADMVYHYTNSRVKSLKWELQTKPPTLRGKYWTPERIKRLESRFHKHPDGTPMNGEEVFDIIWGKDIPAWSLTRLQEIMPGEIIQRGIEYNLFISSGDVSYFGFNDDRKMNYLIGFRTGDEENIFDTAIDMMQWLIDKQLLNKEYYEKDNI